MGKNADITVAGDKASFGTEKIVGRWRKKRSLLVKPIFLLIIIISVVSAALICLPEQINQIQISPWAQLLILISGIGIGVNYVLLPFFYWRGFSVVLSETKIQLDQGVFTKVSRNIQLNRVAAVGLSQGKTEKILDGGKLVIQLINGELVELDQIAKLRSLANQLANFAAKQAEVTRKKMLEQLAARNSYLDSCQPESFDQTRVDLAEISDVQGDYFDDQQLEQYAQVDYTIPINTQTKISQSDNGDYEETIVILDINEDIFEPTVAL